jgi:hypothetical protein
MRALFSIRASWLCTESFSISPSRCWYTAKYSTIAGPEFYHSDHATVSSHSLEHPQMVSVVHFMNLSLHMNTNTPQQSGPSARTVQACELCRVKRARCSGSKPCDRCLQAGAGDSCVYGFPRGELRASLLAAIDDHQNRQKMSSTGQGLRTDTCSGPIPSSQDKSSSNSPHPLKVVKTADDISDDDSITDMSTEATNSPLTSPVDSAPNQKRDKGKGKAQSKSSKRDNRKSRISSACLECKKRRRKCSGEQPCQTCQDFETQCIYDPGADRRSKAYFQRRLAEGIRDAAQTDPTDELVATLQRNLDPAMDQPKSIPFAEPPADSSETDFNQQSQEVQSNRLVCQAMCVLSASGPSPRAVWYPKHLQEQQEARLGGPSHSIPPHCISDSSPLSMAFENVRESVIEMIARSVPFDIALGPLDTQVDLIFRERKVQDNFSASNMACELARMIHPHDVFTQLANAYLLARYMRWIISPTLENYICLPKLMRPTNTQLTIPHYASADLLPMPSVRNCLSKGDMTLVENIGSQSNGPSMKFHWPFDMDKAIFPNPETGMLTTTRLFQICAEDSANWSCGREFLEGTAIMEMAPTIDHQHAWPTAQSQG